MSDIFISYSREDKPKAEKIARALEQHGWSVWWDRKIPVGKSFDKIIEEQLSCAKCVMVLWSNHSIHSNWVKEEASEGQSRNMLAPVMIDKVRIPLGFRRLQTANLSAWNEDAFDEAFIMLAEDVRNIIGIESNEKSIITTKTLPVPPEKQNEPEAITAVSTPDIKMRIPGPAKKPVGTKRVLLLVYKGVSMQPWKMKNSVIKNEGQLKINTHNIEYESGGLKTIFTEVTSIYFQPEVQSFLYNYMVIEHSVNGKVQKMLFTIYSFWGGSPTLKMFEGIYDEYKKGKLPFVKKMRKIRG